MASALGERRLPPEIFRLLREIIYGYCGIWFAAVSAETAACVFTSADDSVACSDAISTSMIAESADCRF